jgi:hypothetical protein
MLKDIVEATLLEGHLDFPGFNGHLGVVVRTWEGL